MLIKVFCKKAHQQNQSKMLWGQNNPHIQTVADAERIARENNLCNFCRHR